jgi:hypothetical protein
VSDVTIPADVAKRLAGHLRGYAEVGEVNLRAESAQQWAELLDPKPLSLREEAAQVVIPATGLCEHTIGDSDAYAVADAVLAVVRDRIQALHVVFSSPGLGEQAFIAKRDVLALFVEGA